MGKNTVRAIRREREEQQRKAEAEARAAEGEKGAELGEGIEGNGWRDGIAQASRNEMTIEEVEAAFPIGHRCEVDPGARRGTIGFAGSLGGKKGLWIGVRLDEPQGQNDGTKDGKQYFECPGPKYGCFVKPENVRVGDYPERDPFASDDEF